MLAASMQNSARPSPQWFGRSPATRSLPATAREDVDHAVGRDDAKIVHQMPDGSRAWARTQPPGWRSLSFNSGQKRERARERRLC